MVTNSQIQALLTARSKTGAPLVDYTLTDRNDGQGATITAWNAATLGPLPTQAEIDALTPAQITAASTAQRQARYTATSRQQIILAIAAAMVRERGLPAWNAMTPQQKKDAVLAQADVIANLLDFIETNLS